MVSLLVGILIAALYTVVAFCIHPILGVLTLLFFIVVPTLVANFTYKDEKENKDKKKK